MTDIEFKIALNERLCDLAELILHQYNPCNQQNGSCVAGSPNPCCSHTRFSKEGCPFSISGRCKFRTIWCKYWLCEMAIRNTVTDCVDTLKNIEQIGKRYGLIGRPYLGEDYVGKNFDLARLENMGRNK
jgi:hypothetical protein